MIERQPFGRTGHMSTRTIFGAAALSRVTQTEADRTFDMLMGSSVPPRRRFIQTHAKDVRNLDV